MIIKWSKQNLIKDLEHVEMETIYLLIREEKLVIMN